MHDTSCLRASWLRTATALLAVCFLGVPAYADSDGYYCVGPGYLAYQFGVGAPPQGPHRLHVVRFGARRALEQPAVLDLPQFQVHGMICGERTVRLAAFNAFYTVQLDERKQPQRVDTEPRGKGDPLPMEFGVARNLGAWNSAAAKLGTDRVSLGATDDGGRYLLEISGSAVPRERCAAAITTRLVRTDRNGREVQHLRIFQGRRPRECGE